MINKEKRVLSHIYFINNKKRESNILSNTDKMSIEIPHYISKKIQDFNNINKDNEDKFIAWLKSPWN